MMSPQPNEMGRIDHQAESNAIVSANVEDTMAKTVVAKTVPPKPMYVAVSVLPRARSSRSAPEQKTKNRETGPRRVLASSCESEASGLAYSLLPGSCSLVATRPCFPLTVGVLSAGRCVNEIEGLKKKWTADGTFRLACASRGMMSASEPAPFQVTEAASESFQAFFRTHREPVARTLALILNDESLGYEAMIRAYRRWSVVSEYDNPGGWAYRVGLNWARSWRRRLSVASRKAPLLANFDQERSVEELAADADLARALSALSEEHRTVVVFRFYRDLPVAEIAELLEIPTGTVKSRLNRARANLAEGLDLQEES